MKWIQTGPSLHGYPNAHNKETLSRLKSGKTRSQVLMTVLMNGETSGCNMVQQCHVEVGTGASTRTVRANHRIKRIFYLNRRHHAVRCRNEMSVQLDFFKIIRCNQFVWTKMKHTNKVTVYIYIYIHFFPFHGQNP